MIPLLSRPGGRSRRGRLVTLVATPVLGLSLIAAVPSPATTTDGADESATGPIPDEDFTPSPVNAEPVAVTLITGDTVLWQERGNGHAGVAEIEQATRDYPVIFDRSGTQEDFYVIPSDVMDYVASGALDRELFNVPGLIRQGLDDKSTGGELPVIVTFDEAADEKELETEANALPAASKAQGIERVQGAGVKVNKESAEKFREAVLATPDAKRGPSTNTQSDSLAGEVDKILLDRMLKIDLDESVPQIGAPEAWDAGFTGEGVTVAVLDTGVDDTHPDLAGQVVTAENFVGEGEPIDDNGHGTHVASTIAGTGAASGGKYTGVAPDAELISGKVCNWRGHCPTSAIMAAMEWAAQQGADIVNMSLGSGTPSAGTDPESQLLNKLSAETGTLFVTSAGNDGGFYRVGSPAAADAALAVGAVDKADQLASLSSRGPRIVDHAVKPEITAPGVDIVAARAAGAWIAPPVDDVYMSLNGTSMASPHVAGAAALLTQATGLTGQELKDALVSTATDGGFRWFEQGVGRVDVPAALESPVYAEGTLNFGEIDGQAERNLVYTNRSADDISLDLAVAATDRDGQPTSGVSLSADTLTVPANGQSTVTVTVAAAAAAGDGPFGGVVTATGPEVELRTGIGFGPPTHEVTIKVLDVTGERIGTPSSVYHFDPVVWVTVDSQRRVFGQSILRFETSGGVATAHLPTGTYTFMHSHIDMRDPDHMPAYSLVELEVNIDGDTSLTLDARDTVLVEPPVMPQPVVVRDDFTAIRRDSGIGGQLVQLLGGSDNANTSEVYVSPTPQPKLALLFLFQMWKLTEPQPMQPLPWEPPDTDCSPNAPRRNLVKRCFSATPDYMYNLMFAYENGMPDDFRQKIKHRDLVKVPTRYHSALSSDSILKHVSMWDIIDIPNINSGDPMRVWMEPGEVTQYVTPDERISWETDVSTYRRMDGRGTQHERSFDVFWADEAGSRRPVERWFDAPHLRPGVGDLREDYVTQIPVEWGLFGTLANGGMRGGPDGDLFTIPSSIRNTRGHESAVKSSCDERMWNLDTGKELERVHHRSGLFVFPLAPEEATYRLEMALNPECATSQSWVQTTTWTFTSRPSDARVPKGYRWSRDRLPLPDWEFTAQIQPLIQLEYDLGLDLHNRAPAGRAHEFIITAGHHSKAIDRSPVTDLAVQASFDDGKTWTDARVVGKPKDTWDTGGYLPSAAPYQQFRVVLQIPPLHRTNGYVTLRVKAEDANGGTVDQTLPRAYVLKAPTTRGTGRVGSTDK